MKKYITIVICIIILVLLIVTTWLTFKRNMMNRENNIYEDVSIYKEDKKRVEIVDNAEGYISEEEAIIKLKTLGTQKLGLSSEIKDYEFKIVGKVEIEQDMCYEIEAEYKTDETHKEVSKFAVSKDENKIYKMENDKYIQIEI